MEIRKNEPMNKHTSFRVGGPADVFLIPETPEEFQAAVKRLKAEGGDWYVIGNGSNLLVSDKGFRGTVLSTERLDGLQVTETRIRAGAGVLLSKLANLACRYSLEGLAFAAGIPGSVGGAAVMNAGAYGGEMKDVLESVLVLDENGEFLTLKAEELELGYRTSIILKKHYLILEAVFALRSGKETEIRAEMDELAARRKEKQPLEYPSAGSTFKRPAGYFAGKLIEDAGLRGFSVGGAQVSEKHCGFVINRDHATAADIYDLCGQVAGKVKEQNGIILELEVKLLGEF